MKRYSESKTQDEMGDMQDGVYETSTGEYIRVDELIKWLDAEIAMSTENLEAAEQSKMVVAINIAQAMLATYRAVKAHIEG
jgi:murein L,D-transpeptidase YcbB/YkuD